MKVTPERVGAAAVACLVGACVVLTLRIHAETNGIRADLARHRQDVDAFVAAMASLGVAAERKPVDSGVTDACGCPGPDEVCRDVCTACICAHMPDVWVPVDEARRKCWKECDP